MILPVVQYVVRITNELDSTGTIGLMLSGLQEEVVMNGNAHDIAAWLTILRLSNPHYNTASQELLGSFIFTPTANPTLQ